MKIGLFGINTNACADPKTAATVAVGANKWRRIVMDSGTRCTIKKAPSPTDPETPFLHPSTLLAYIASVTKVKLGTGITLIAQEIGCVGERDGEPRRISSGRLLLG